MPHDKWRLHAKEGVKWGALLTFTVLWSVIGFLLLQILELRSEVTKVADVALSAGGLDKEGDVQTTQLWLFAILSVAAFLTAWQIVQAIVTEGRRSQSEGLIKNHSYQIQKMEAVRRLSGGLSHGFNNILSAVNGYAEFLVEDLQDRPDEQKFAKKIVAATKHARDLIDQILIFSRSNDVGVDKMKVAQIIDSSVNEVMNKASGSIKVTYENDLKDAHIIVNDKQFEKAFQHVIDNALDEMNVGQPEETSQTATTNHQLKIKISKASLERFAQAHMLMDIDPATNSLPMIDISEDNKTGLCTMVMGQLVKGRDYVRICVEDTGFGMSRSVLEYAFEPFFTTKPMNKGTGLGLSVVQGVVLQHGGAIVIESKMGQGTRVSLYFPTADNQSEVTALEGIQLEQSANDGSARILLVEDQRTVREVSERMLGRLGYDVVSALNGRHALEIIERYHERWPFDLVFTDHAMPQMDGLELAEHCYETYPDLKFIIASGYSQEKMHDILKLYPTITAVLRKPVKKDTIKHEIEKALACPKAILAQEEKGKKASSKAETEAEDEQAYYEQSSVAS